MARETKLTPAQIEAAQETPTRPEFSEIGASGTRLTGGWISGYEQNASLSGAMWAQECELMLRTDPQVSSIIDAVIQTLLSGTWRFSPVEGSEGSARAAEYLNECFGMAGKRGRLQGGWEATLAKILGYVPLGYRYLEEVYSVSEGRVWLRKLSDREPSAHRRWITDDRTGDLVAVEQQVVGSRSGTKQIPANKLVLFTRRQSGQNYEGRGLMRSMHPWFLLKRHTYDLLAIGAERWTTPTPIVRVDRQAAIEAGFSDEQINQAVEAAKANAKAYVAHEAAYLIEIVGVSFDIFGAGAFDPEKAASIIRVCDEQMTAAALLGFLRLGVTDTGSRSVGEVLQSFFRRACINDLDVVAQVIGGPAGPGTGTAGRLLSWNFPSLPASEAPRLVHEGLNPSPLMELAASLPSWVQSQLLTWSRNDQDALRHAAGLDPLPEETVTEAPQG